MGQVITKQITAKNHVSRAGKAFSNTVHDDGEVGASTGPELIQLG
jgi:hypothetical protein